MNGPIDAIATCTVRIVGSKLGANVSIGTGFLYAFSLTPPTEAEPYGRVLPAVITNKHVLQGCDTVHLRFTVAKTGAQLDQLGQPADREYLDAQLGIADGVVQHPNAAVDLCAFPVGMITNHMQEKGLGIFHTFLNQGHRLTEEAKSIMRPLEPVAMVGYPNGIWDSVNNAPIIRRGITATHPLVKYEGRSEFVIDTACFPGSSGSPVFLFEDGMYRTRGGAMTPGTKIALIGVLYAGPQFNAEGRLEARPIPHSVIPTPVTSMPMNLGFVIQADEIDTLQAEFLKVHANHRPAI
jgi:hypothetical protein